MDSPVAAATVTQSVTDGNVSGTMNGTDHHEEEAVHSRSSPPMQAAYQQIEPAAPVAPPQKVATPVESVPEKVEHPVEPIKEPEPAVVPNIPAKQIMEPAAPVIPSVSFDRSLPFQKELDYELCIVTDCRALLSLRPSPTCLRLHPLTMEQPKDCPT